MKQTWSFIPPIITSTQSKIQADFLEKSREHYENAEYKESLHSLLDYLNKDFREKYGNENGTEFCIPHGSIVVKISIKDDTLHIVTDFLKLPEKGRVAMLRELAKMNTGTLMLARFVKQEDIIKMEYHCPLSLSDPDKLHDILENICLTGDTYDDKFCDQFGATRCYEPIIAPYTNEEIDNIYNALQEIGNTAINEVDAYIKSRQYGYAWITLNTAIMQFYYFASPQGQVKNLLLKAINDLNEDISTTEVVARGKNYLKKLLETPKEKLAEDLYRVDILVSENYRSSLRNIQENMLEVYKEVTQAIQNEDYERVTLRIIYIFYKAFYYNDMQDDLAKLMSQALKDAAGKSMKEAAEVLYEAIDDIMEGELEEEEDLASMYANPEVSAEQQEIMQQAFANVGLGDLQELQNEMMSAMGRGDMQEYMRLAAEYQKQMMDKLTNNN